MNTSVKLAINEENLVKNLKFAFSNFTTFLAELIQNSRRAGATGVDITFEGDTLSVVDDGAGIENFQHLFTIADSGWDNQTMSLENPFGMGFTSALFACEKLMVESRGQRLEEYTADILSMTSLKVTPGEVTSGTRLTMRKLTFDVKGIEPALQQIAYGYSIPIRYNDRELDRPHELNVGEFTQSPIGMVKIPDLANANVDVHVTVYLQGILVLGNTTFSEAHTIVIHLDSTKFHAKLPDRKCLIDAAQRKIEIRQSIIELLHSLLYVEQQSLDSAQFVELYWKVASKYAPDLLREHPLVPAGLFDKVGDLVASAHWYYWKAQDNTFGTYISRADFEQGKIRVVRGSGYVQLDFDPLSSIKLAYVMEKDVLVIDDMLPKGHWLLNAPSIADLDVTYEIVNSGSIAGNDFQDYDFEIQICDAIRISGPWGDVEIDNVEIAVCSESDENISKISLYSPKKAFSKGSGVQQFANFSDDDRFAEQYHDDQIATYARWIKQARNTKPVDLLNDLLSDVFVDVASAHGLRFVIEVGENGRLKVVEQLTAEPA